MKLVGVDIGGTFTDLVLYDAATGDVFVHKVRSTPADPGRALISGLLELCAAAEAEPAAITSISHGTTVATNAVLEHKGATAGLITTKGFRDVVHIGRHQRPQHYSIVQDIPWQATPFVRRRHRRVVTERLDARGAVVEPLDEDEVRAEALALKAAGVDAVAVCFLFSFRNPDHERRAAEIVAEEMPGAFVTTSADIVPQFREFERFTTACMNAFVGPGIEHYLKNLAGTLADHGVRAELRMMTSNGGVVSPEVAAERPVTLMMSGPAAGVLGGVWVGHQIDRRRLITFDVGGTSADIAIVTDEGVPHASARDTTIAGFPLLAPMLDIHTIGAGGGSIARVDPGGAFRVGPQSAGADPGPACYGSGSDATVTDANVVLGRIDPDRFLGGTMPLARDAAVDAVQRIADQLDISVVEAAEGILSIINANMAQAIRSLTVQRGHDPREFSLVAFGGGGPLHAAEVADALGIPEVIVPSAPGITSAIGLLTSDLRYDQMQTVFNLADDVDEAALEQAFVTLEAELSERLDSDSVEPDGRSFVRALDCRYAGQGYELRLELASDEPFAAATLDGFHALHESEYGYRFDDPIEIVNLRVTAFGERPKITEMTAPSTASALTPLYEGRCVFRINDALTTMSTSFYDRASLPVDDEVSGPAVIFQPDTTILVPPGWSARLLEKGLLVLVAQRAQEDRE